MRNGQYSKAITGASPGMDLHITTHIIDDTMRLSVLNAIKCIGFLVHPSKLIILPKIFLLNE